MGRTIDDDVVDALLTVFCNSGSTVGGGVTANDKVTLAVFSSLQGPHSGNP